VVGAVTPTREELLALIKMYGDARAWQKFKETSGTSREEEIARQASECVLKDVRQALDEYEGPSK
jgi:hypothetical protein